MRSCWRKTAPTPDSGRRTRLAPDREATRQTSLSAGDSAVDDESLAGDEGGSRGEQKQNCAHDVCGAPETAQGGSAHNLEALLISQRAAHLGFEVTGCDRVDPDVPG